MSVEQQSRPAVRDQLYVGGAWVTPDGSGTLAVVEASTEQPLATVPEGTAEDARRAIAAAREAFDGWARRHRSRSVSGCCARSPTGSRRVPTRSPAR